MLIYETECGKTIVAVAGNDISEAEAIRAANKHFKVKLEKLEARRGYILGAGLFWESPSKKAYGVWAVYKKGAEV